MDFNLSLLVICSETLVAVFITVALYSDAALCLPKWHRLLMSTGAAALFAQTALTISGFGGYNSSMSDWMVHAKDLSISALALAPVVMLMNQRRVPIEHTSRTSPPSGPRPTA